MREFTIGIGPRGPVEVAGYSIRVVLWTAITQATRAVDVDSLVRVDRLLPKARVV